MSIVMRILTHVVPLTVEWLLAVREAWRTPVIVKRNAYRGTRRKRAHDRRVRVRVEAYGNTNTRGERR